MRVNAEIEVFEIYDVDTDSMVPLTEERFKGLLDAEKWLRDFVMAARVPAKLPKDLDRVLKAFTASRPFKAKLY